MKYECTPLKGGGPSLFQVVHRLLYDKAEEDQDPPPHRPYRGLV
jgi:hypothetical protein